MPVIPDATPGEPGLLRIGELSRRHGVSPDVLRAWERRYGLLHPQRSPGGFRLYAPADEARVRSMRRYMAQGFSPAVSARMALEAPQRAADAPGEQALEDGRRELGAALESFRDVEAQAALDRLLARFSTEAVLGEVVLPYLREVGDRWEAGRLSVGQEHFASEVLRGRLMALARGWDVGAGPRALLACPPAERHDLALICFGLGLRERGWRITFLGPDAPLDAIRDVAAQVRPGIVVICAEQEGPMRAAAGGIGLLCEDLPVAMAGRGASPELARAAGARLLQDAPLAAAARVAAERG